MSEVCMSAPGKIMVLGEYAVLMGGDCMCVAVDSRVTVCVTPSNDRSDMVLLERGIDDTFVQAALDVYRRSTGVVGRWKIQTVSTVKNISGLGSSSATVVATLSALSNASNLTLTSEQMFKMAYEVVLQVQDGGSGYDVAAAVYGGALVYNMHLGVRERLPMESFPIIVAHSGQKAQTSLMIERFASKKTSRDETNAQKKLLAVLSTHVEQGKSALKRHNFEALGAIMTKSHEALQGFGVSTDRLDKMVYAANQAGAYGAKLSGAGGGDCMIAIAPSSKREAVKMAIEKTGGKVIPVNFDPSGIRQGHI